MSNLSENIAWQTAQFRRDKGQKVRFNGVDYDCTVAKISNADAGVDKLPSDGIKAFIASADPRQFRLIPADFAPTTSVLPPQEGNTLLWHGLQYKITRVSYEDFVDDTFTVCCNAYREVV